MVITLAPVPAPARLNAVSVAVDPPDKKLTSPAIVLLNIARFKLAV